MNKTTEFELQLKQFTDDALVTKLEQLFIKEKKLGDAILLCLKEIKHRRIYNWLGFASMFEMLVTYFKLSESGAYQRLNALKVIEVVPAAQDFLITGAVSLGSLSEMQSFINKQEKLTGEKVSLGAKQEIVEEIKNKSVKETRELLLGKNPEVNLPPDKEKKITASLTLLQMKLDEENMKLIEELKNLLSHKIPDGNWNEVMKEILPAAIERIKKQKGLRVGAVKQQAEIRADVARQEKKLTPSMVSQYIKRSRHIPMAIRREVFRRANNQCQFVSAQGRRCECKSQLEVNHLIAFSKGGTHDLETLDLRCRSHNQYYCIETHGFIYNGNLN